MKTSTLRIICPLIGVSLLLGLMLALKVAFPKTQVDSRVIMANGNQVVIFVTLYKVEERLKGLWPRFRIVSIDNDDGLFTIVIEQEVRPNESKNTED